MVDDMRFLCILNDTLLDKYKGNTHSVPKCKQKWTT